MATQLKGSIPRAGTLKLGRGVALYMGAVLGPGVLVLPQLAAESAGPASVWAWAALLALSVPVAMTFASLGIRFPDGGGAATFARRAFGDRVAAVVGWWFYFVIPIGATAAAFIGAQYVSVAFGLSDLGTVAVAGALLLVAFAANFVGLRLSGGTQLFLMVLLVALLVTAIIVAAPQSTAVNFTPFAPHGTFGVLAAMGVLFFAFAGWEAASHLSGEFADPKRYLRKVTGLTLLIVSSIYIGLSVVTIGVLGAEAGMTAAPLTVLLATGFGGLAPAVTAAAAIVLSLGAVNTYVAGASRLGAALARDGSLPRFLAKGSAPGEVPRRSLAVLAGMAFAAMGFAVVASVELETLMRATAACLAMVTIVGTASAIRLLASPRQRATAIGATVFAAAVLVSCGRYLVVPLLIALAAVWFTSSRQVRRPSADPRLPVPVAQRPQVGGRAGVG